MLVRRKPFVDERGLLERLYCDREFAGTLGRRSVLQINHSHTASRGTVRGLHFQQPPHAELKVVSCIRGAIFDVAVDLRKHSKTFLQWHGEILSAANHTSSVIPEGFAHGFQALEDGCELVYLHTASYVPEVTGSLNPTDPAIGIAWPLPISLIAAKDATIPSISAHFEGLDI